jgi:hypothetical protein
MSRVNKKVGGIHSRVDTMYHWMQLDHLNWDLGGLNADNIDDIMDEGDDHNNDDDWLLIHIAHDFCIFFIMNILYILFVWNMNLMSHIFYEFNVLNVWTSLLHYEEHYWCWESIGLCIKCFIQGEIFF